MLLPAPADETPWAYMYSGTRGRLICFIHTWGTDSDDFFYLRYALLHETLPCNLISVNLPGHGTAPIIANPSVAAFAYHVLDNLPRYSDVILVGHGQGCRIALEAWHQAFGSDLWRINIVGICFLDGFSYLLRENLRM